MNREGAEAGFTLVEAVAALAVSAIVSAGLLSALGSAAGRSAEAGVRNDALKAATLLLEEGLVAADATTLPKEGSIDGRRLAWTRSYGPVGDPYDGLQRVKVEVSWQSVNKKGATRLEAIRLAPA